MKKKNGKWKRYLLAGILTAVFLLPSLPFMSSCSTVLYYDNADKYTSGGTELESDTVKAIDVEWFNGSVDISFSSDSGAPISVSETANKWLDAESSLHYWLDGKTLKIQFAMSGKTNFNDLNKSLKITLPADHSLLLISANAVSSNITVTDARADAMTVSAVSGNVEFTGTRVANDITVSSTSGNVKGNIITPCDRLSISTTSGSVDFSTEAKLKNLGVETVSGNIRLSNLNPARNAKVDSVSGNIDLEFLENAGFRFGYSTVSGDFHSDFGLYLDGNKFVHGNPIADFSAETVSGDIRLISIPT